MAIESFHVQILGGKVVWKSEEHREMFQRFIAQFPNGKYTLNVTAEKSKRSEQQNRYYWFYLEIIARESGHTKDELHEYFKQTYLSDKELNVFGKDIRTTKSTTSISKGEFSDYLANIMVETNIPLPDTTEFFGYSYHK